MSKEKVPKFTNCTVDENGDAWCYDEIAGLVCRIIPVAPSSIPQEVLYKLLQAANKKDG